MDVVERRFFAPGNPWPADPRQKQIGQYAEAKALGSAEAVSLEILPTGLGMALEEVRQLVQQVKEDISNINIHFYYT